ncbi:efflux RND transporter periplasmic adaptor subunit [Paraglaciecola psychrophila]|uniref:RND family efflux transporter MFP subunit n=1 Tax=Paraglaciecola psychrophila 170 TaxID=1129794 RepID=K6Z5U8_9ALTE|nr:efflux RND transporter periplasmic adaptor subunit [Paraglaciecola psychrophila]AGH44138.1 RND family efflux transporter MFP subunit [Paraglaciecola psychrophila 170]GAC40459.1 secretion protein [Paraglaciecola psychrophila 170]
MSKVKKWLIPLAILVFTLVIANIIFNNPPESKRGGPSGASQLTVEVTELAPQQFTVIIDTFGTVHPRTQNALVAQVSGQINYVSPQFRNGGFFDKGGVLLKLDQRDYDADVKIAEAGLLSAEQVLLEEQANARQAQTDWKRLGNGQAPIDLVLRKPQLAAAQASLLSAEAKLTIAKLALERTQITAPYDGRILEQLVDFGQVLSSNSQVAEIYSTDSVEIRLPINNSDIGLVNFPEEYRTSNSLQSVIEARFTSSLSKSQTWLGKIIRTEGAIDSSTQQLYIVAQIEDPYNPKLHPGPSIKIGQYVNAQVRGKTLDDAIVINNSAIYQGSYVYVVEKGLLKRRDISIRWQNSQNTIIENGLSPGELLVTTPLGQVSSGTRVSIAEEQQPQRQASPEQEAKLQQMAKKMGITVEELRAKRSAKKASFSETNAQSSH